MDLLQTQGYSHIARSIFQFLDDQSLCQSRLVCHAWRQFIDAQRFYWQRIVNCNSAQEVCNKNEEWQQVFDSFQSSSSSGGNHYQLGQLLQQFFIYQKRHLQSVQNSEAEDEDELEVWDPYHVPVMTQNLDHIAILWPHLHDSVEWNFCLV